MDLAPIILFVYNRPWHTEQTLHALMQNELADQSVLYIYADGPKENATEADQQKIEEVRQFIRTKKWCKEVHIIESESNKGLADSIIYGVTEIVNEYGKVIVLEDDIVSSMGFLKYMNDALKLYENESRVMHISGYMFPHNKRLKSQAFFCQIAFSWGWATWKNSWMKFRQDGENIKDELIGQNLMAKFNMDEVYNFKHQLEANITGSLKTWAVFWHASIILNNAFSLIPATSLVKNIGNDGSGENCLPDAKYGKQTLPATKVRLHKSKNITESLQGRQLIKGYYLSLVNKNPLKQNFFKRVFLHFREYNRILFYLKNNQASLRKIISEAKKIEVIQSLYPEVSINPTNYFAVEDFTKIKFGKKCFYWFI